MKVGETKQVVTGCDRVAAPAALLADTGPALEAWYADPLSRAEARRLQEAARCQRRERLCRGKSCFRLELLELVCHCWLDRDAALKYGQLAALPLDDAGRALLELVYGQLLISRKLQAARPHLERGFALAARHLASPDYFVLLGRHERLDRLPLGNTAARPAPLQALLNEAGVIAQLTERQRTLHAQTHCDTVG